MDLEVSPRKRACWISHTFIVCSVSAAVFVTQVPHGYRTVEALARGIARTPPEGGRRAARRYAGVELRLVGVHALGAREQIAQLRPSRRSRERSGRAA